MPNIISAVDPNGIQVTCTESQWNEHVVTGHNDMKGKEDAVQQTIAQPDAIYTDASYKDRLVYYRKQPNKNFYVKVVVKVTDRTGVIITAFHADKPKTGEDITWKRSKP